MSLVVKIKQDSIIMYLVGILTEILIDQFILPQKKIKLIHN